MVGSESLKQLLNNKRHGLALLGCSNPVNSVWVQGLPLLVV
jgi:hypothetical protein